MQSALQSRSRKSVFDVVVNQGGNNKAWVAAANTINTFFSNIENQILYDVGYQMITLACQDLAKYQTEEKWIYLEVQFKKKESILINIHTNSYPESLKSFCKGDTAHRCMKIFYTARGNNSQDN